MKDEETVVPETIFEEPNMKEEQIKFEIPLDKLVANVIEKKDVEIAQLRKENKFIEGVVKNLKDHPDTLEFQHAFLDTYLGDFKRMKVFIAQTFDIAMKSEGQCACEELRLHCYNDNFDLENLIKDVK